MKYKLELKCRRCNKLIGKAKTVDNEGIAERIYIDAVIKLSVGWCKECNEKPYPKVTKLEEVK